MNTETVDNFSCYFRWPEVGKYNGKNVLYVNYFITLQESSKSQASVKKLAIEIHFADGKKT